VERVQLELWDSQLESWVEKDVAVTLFNLTNALLQKGSDKEALKYSVKSNVQIYDCLLVIMNIIERQ